MAWEKGIEELGRRRALAEAQGGAINVGRQHRAGRLTVRERIEQLIDPGSFQEIGKTTGAGEYSESGELLGLTPAPYVAGLAKVDGRSIVVGGEDFTVRGGTTASLDRRKGGQGGVSEDLAHEYRIPLVNLIDGSGGSVTSSKRRGHAVFPGVDSFDRSVDLMGEVPVVGAVLGSAAGGPAGRAILSHFSVMVKDTSQVFAAGPAVVKRSLGQDVTKEELGGPAVAVEQGGAIDNVAENELECLEMVRRFLSFMPQNVWELPPRTASSDRIDRCEDALRDIIPEERRRPYDMRKLINLIFDEGSVFEIQPRFGKGLVTCLARLDGYTVGIVANNPMVYGGAMDVGESLKQCHFVELCDTFHIPLVFLVDVPGFMVGLQAESRGVLRAGMRAVYVASQATVPVITLVVRKCYGMAGMATCQQRGVNLKLAWPSAEWGSLPVEGGVAVAYRREIEAADDPRAKEAELEEELRIFASPFRTAEAFGVEDIIDPRETRPYLIRYIEAMQGKLASTLGQKARLGVRP
ncbi:MAG: Propionyl-CoA carboxylase beta chain [Alphaproteobacteria bacterium MarineAlpha4_Bin2]|nr:MAG: Propionyl-CoA carboxylase beta chain [Alphaproteobacteria bacterium MarineAlpha4_Bin2]